MYVAKRDIGLLVVGFFLPPIAVWAKRGIGLSLLLNVGLTFCGAVPGIVHAWYIVIRYRRPPPPTTPPPFDMKKAEMNQTDSHVD